MRKMWSVALLATLVLGTSNLTAAVDAGSSTPQRKGPKDQTTIADLALATPALSTLVAALEKADLVDAVDARGQLTVFAPTNAAFDATADALGFDSGTDLVDALSVSQLTEILLYHIAPGRRDSTSVLDSDQIRTLNRAFLFPSLVGGVPYINGSEIVIPDVLADNGIVHVIGTGVLIPPAE